MSEYVICISNESNRQKAFGYRTCEALEVALYHTLGDLPEPELTHRFC